MKRLMIFLFMLGLFSMYSCSKEAPVTPNSEKTVLHQSVDSRSADGLTNSNVGDGDRINYPYAKVISIHASNDDIAPNGYILYHYSLVTSFYSPTTINIYFRLHNDNHWTFIGKANRDWGDEVSAGFSLSRTYSSFFSPYDGEDTYFMATRNTSTNPPSTLPAILSGWNSEFVGSYTVPAWNSSPGGPILHFFHPY